jgi:hypothetical protein
VARRQNQHVDDVNADFSLQPSVPVDDSTSCLDDIKVEPDGDPYSPASYNTPGPAYHSTGTGPLQQDDSYTESYSGFPSIGPGPNTRPSADHQHERRMNIDAEVMHQESSSITDLGNSTRSNVSDARSDEIAQLRSLNASRRFSAGYRESSSGDIESRSSSNFLANAFTYNPGVVSDRIVQQHGRRFSSAGYRGGSDMTTEPPRPHGCGVCGKRFSVAYRLKEHMRIHTGEKPYKCDLCGRAFTQASGLLLHKRTHAAERPYICRMCGKGYITRSGLVTHAKVHSHSNQ